MTGDARRLNEERFTQTARQYATSRIAERQEQSDALQHLVAPSANDDVLDVACGPGALLAGLSPRVRRAVGVDLTMAMLREAWARGQPGRTLLLVRGEGERLPFHDGTFSLVLTTWAVHHFGDPRRVVAEMVRVCRSGGRVVIGDLYGSEDEAKRRRQNEIERLRDPAHIEILDARGLESLLTSAGLTLSGRADGELVREIGEWCRIAGTPPEVAVRVRQMVRDTMDGDLAGMEPVPAGDQLTFRHRWAIVVGMKG
jgi:SAM-dependent methyltransferase